MFWAKTTKVELLRIDYWKNYGNCFYDPTHSRILYIYSFLTEFDLTITLPSLNEITTSTDFDSVHIKVHFDVEDSTISPQDNDLDWVCYIYTTYTIYYTI